MIYSCFPFLKPTFTQLHEPSEKNTWNQWTVTRNIKAVPYSDNIDDLIKVKKLIKHYLPVVEKSRDPGFKERTLRYLNQLDSLTNVRLAEISDWDTGVAVSNSDSTTLISRQENARNLRIDYDKKIINLTNLINTHSQDLVQYHTYEKLIMEMTLQARELKKYLLEKHQKNDNPPDENKVNPDTKFKLWDFKDIKNHCERIPEMNLSEVSKILSEGAIQLNYIQKKMLRKAETLNSLKQSLHLMSTNEKTMAKIVGKVNASLHDIIDPVVSSSEKDNQLVQLESDLHGCNQLHEKN